MKEIKLTQGKVALVDDEDFEWLNKWKWCYGKNGYASRSHKAYEEPLMHRLILDTPKGMLSDHINRNKLDNRKSNLRICSMAENMRNVETRADNTSGYKGVTWNKNAKKWAASITVNYISEHLGYFDDIKEAAEAYNKASKKLHGDFSKLNRITT